MLGDKELDAATAQLTQFQISQQGQQQSLSEILSKYAELVENYRRLKSDYEEERDSRERYKQMARGQERNPFVLVLVDGDGYVFDDDLVSNGAEGGQRAAHLLNDAVTRSLRERGLDHCKIMVRVYTNLVGLSKALSKVKLSGPEKRSQSTFAASFTRSNDMFDFVDAGELKENADSKIRALFRHFVDNAQCRHIYFAACHDVGYINELTPYANNRHRITLVRHPAFHNEFRKLGMRIEDLPNIFRTTPLDTSKYISAAENAKPSPSPLKTIATPATTRISEALSTSGEAKVCQFYPKGQCKYGNKCKNLHIKQTNGTNSDVHPAQQYEAKRTTSFGLSDIKNWRENAGTNTSTLPFQMNKLTANDNDLMSGRSTTSPSGFGSSTSNDPTQHQIDFATQLPQANNIPAGTVPVNVKDYRLDAYTPPPSSDDLSIFHARTAERKLCNNHHVHGYCPAGDSCTFDHGLVSDGVLNALKQVVRSMPCPRKGACRREVCIYGHICQKAECKYRGGKVFCKFPPYVHGQDLAVAGYKTAEAQKLAVQVNGSGMQSEKLSTRESSPNGEIEPETEEGALLDLEADESSTTWY